MASFYSPSGSFKPQALVAVPLVVAVISSLLGILYAVLVSFIAFPWVTIPLLVIWGFITIISSKWAIKLNAARAPIKVAVLVFIGSLVGYYVHFAFFCTIVTTGHIIPGATPFAAWEVGETFSFDELRQNIANPGALLECIREHYVFGLPVLSANTSGGFLFWLLWVIEFVLYETPVVVMGYRYAGEPYEEDMQEWLLKQKLENPFVLLPTDPKEINAVFGRIAEGDISYFLTAPPAKHPHGSFLGLDIYYSEGAPDACVTVKHHIHTVKRRSKTILLEYLMIPEVQAERIMRHLG